MRYLKFNRISTALMLQATCVALARAMIGVHMSFTVLSTNQLALTVHLYKLLY